MTTTTGMVATGNPTNDKKASGVAKLRAAATEASQVRALSTHPDVVALRVESIRTQVDRCMWTGIILGLAFTMVNVQDFAARNAVLWSLAWLSAWLLDPMVSLVLIAVLRAEQITARYQVFDDTRWIKRTKRFAFGATYVMNTWSSFLHKDVAGIVLHSVPPLLVFCAAETAPVLRDRLTEAVLRAERAAAVANLAQDPESVGQTYIDTQTVAPPADDRPALETATPDQTTTTTKRPARKQPSTRPAGKRVTKPRSPAKTNATGKDVARSHWDAETASGRTPSGAELARVAEVDASLGRRWAREWSGKNDTPETTDNTGTAEHATDIRSNHTTDPDHTTDSIDTEDIESEEAA